MTRHRRQPPTFVLERLSLGVTTPGRCGLFDAYEGRNITEAEEAEYLRLARLHAVAVELEGYDDDEEDA